jgi:hypothetical protein
MGLFLLRALPVLLAIITCSCAGTNSNKPLNDPPAVDLSRVRFSGGDGNDCNSRIVINGVETEPAGIQAERFWLNKHYPGFKKSRQEMFNCDGKPVDWVTIQTADGSTRDVVFDISAFFGK